MIMNPTAANVLRIFREATPAQVADGRGWYARANAAARELANLGDGDVARAAAVLAVLSPSTPWGRNVALARQAYAMAAQGATFDDIVTRPSQGGQGLGTKGDSARKAAALVLGAAPESVVSGPKVIPFWLRIVDAATGATGPASVVVDRHAFDIAVGRVTDDQTRGTFLGRKGGHHNVAMAYVRAASVLRRTGEAPGITPSELQAVTWVTWRANHAHAMGKAEARRDALQAA
jgi:hypothetical protein